MERTFLACGETRKGNDYMIIKKAILTHRRRYKYTTYHSFQINSIKRKLLSFLIITKKSIIPTIKSTSTINQSKMVKAQVLIVGLLFLFLFIFQLFGSIVSGSVVLAANTLSHNNGGMFYMLLFSSPILHTCLQVSIVVMISLFGLNYIVAPAMMKSLL